MKKKMTALVLALLLVFALTGCQTHSEPSSMYAQAENWAYLEADKTAAADVFFICPTVYGGEADQFYMSMDDEATKADFLGATNMENGKRYLRPECSILRPLLSPGGAECL